MKLTTERLILRPFQVDDQTALFEYRSDAEANKYQGWIPTNIKDVEDFFAKLASKINVPGSWFQLAIIETNSQKLIGDVGIHFLEDDIQQVELGYTIHREYQRKGYATEALTAVLHYLFSDLKKHRITASIDPENLSSIRLLEKLRFRKEAHFVESLFIKDKWVDDVIYAMLRSEWIENVNE